MNQETFCPECGTRHHEDFVRCPKCHAYMIDVSPWQGDFNLVAVALTLLLWWGLDALLRQPFMPTATIFGDAISRTILGLGLYGLLLLALKAQVLRRQLRAFTIVRTVLAKAPQGLGEDVLAAARDEVDEAKLGPYNRFLAYQRLRWLASASKVEQVDRQGLLEALRQHGETDWDGLESSFSFTQYLIWLLPSVGFLGTVWGMTVALQAFSGNLGSASDLSFNSALMETTRGLGTAFHTTLVGLAAVIPLLAGATVLRRRSQGLLEHLDKYFLRLAACVLYHGDAAALSVPEAVVPPPLPPPPPEELAPAPEAEAEAEPEPVETAPAEEPEPPAPSPIAAEPVAAVAPAPEPPSAPAESPQPGSSHEAPNR
jgi:biopolymer transport protein ExbB/TolQ